jgi:hypothetical protein
LTLVPVRGKVGPYRVLCQKSKKIRAPFEHKRVKYDERKKYGKYDDDEYKRVQYDEPKKYGKYDDEEYKSYNAPKKYDEEEYKTYNDYKDTYGEEEPKYGKPIYNY